MRLLLTLMKQNVLIIDHNVPTEGRILRLLAHLLDNILQSRGGSHWCEIKENEMCECT